MISQIAKRQSRTIAKIIFAAAAFLSPAVPALAEPAMWVARDEDSTVYFFGTFHALKADMQWQSQKMEAALAESDELWVEITDPNPAALANMTILNGLDLRRPLSSKLTPEDQKRLKEAAAVLGLPVKRLNQMRPWLAALAVSTVPFEKTGYDPRIGADRVLMEKAAAAGKTIKTFETPEQQAGFFGRLPQPVEVKFLSLTLRDISEKPNLVDELAAAWLSGNLESIQNPLAAEMKAELPELYNVLYLNRNLAWAEVIDQMMEGSGTHFIAVGAGHLVSGDSVQNQLKKRGISVEPY